MELQLVAIWRLLAALILACCVGTAVAEDGGQEAETSGTLPLEELPILMVGGSGMAGSSISFALYEDGTVVRRKYVPGIDWRDTPTKSSAMGRAAFLAFLSETGYHRFNSLPECLETSEDVKVADVGTTVVWIRRGDAVKVISVYALGYSENLTPPEIRTPELERPILFARRVSKAVHDYSPVDETVLETSSSVVEVHEYYGWKPGDGGVPWPSGMKYELLNESVPDIARHGMVHLRISEPLTPELVAADFSKPKVPIIFRGRGSILSHRVEFPGEFQLKRMAMEVEKRAKRQVKPKKSLFNLIR